MVIRTIQTGPNITYYFVNDKQIVILLPQIDKIRSKLICKNITKRVLTLSDLCNDMTRDGPR